MRSSSRPISARRRARPSPSRRARAPTYKADDFKAYGRFVRERHDDIAWENDRVAHRMYGPDLEIWKKEPLTSSGIDVWVKRTKKLVVNDWYMTDDYHRDNGDGADFYSVSKSRGCGGIAVFTGDKPSVSRNFVTSRVLAQGPLRVMFELAYAPFEAGPNLKVTETKRITLDAGHNFNRIASTFKVEGGGAPKLDVGVGIGKHANTDLKTDKLWARTWEKVKDDDSSLGCAVVLPAGDARVDPLDRPRHVRRREGDAGRALRLLHGLRLEQAAGRRGRRRRVDQGAAGAGARHRVAREGHAGEEVVGDDAADEVAEIRAHVLPHFDGWDGAAVARIGGGLINRSYLLTRGDGGRAVLQAVNAIFPPEMHGNIVAVTERLAAAGLVTPRLLPTRDGRPYVNAAGGGLWRLLTHIDGVSFDVVGSPDAGARGRRAGRPVSRRRRRADPRVRRHARRRPRHAPPPGAAGRGRRDARRAPPDRRGRGRSRDAILAGAAALAPLPCPSTLPPRICHGDLKFNNILFAGRTPPADARAVCLIDLDTVGPLSLAFELGDAWRSWCNRAGEDDVNAVLDLEIMRASLTRLRSPASAAR